MEAALSDLENALGHRFAKPELLERALTHRSVVKQQAAGMQAQNDGHEEPAAAGDNERLEFLGDAVLGLVVAEELFKAHPEWQEGELTRVRAKLVSRQHMAEVAQAIGLGSYLRLSRGEDRGGLRHKSTVLSNGMEAVLAAMFLDGGLEPVRAFAGRWVMGEAAEQRHAPAVPSLSRVAVQQLQVDAREERRQFTFSGGANCVPGPLWETINRRCRSIFRRCGPARRFTRSEVKAVPAIASGSWWRFC